MRTIDLLATARVAVLVVAAFAASGQCVAAAKTPAAAAAPASEPEFGGQCAMSLAEGQQVATNCSVKWAAPDGKTYCFGDEDAKQRFLKDPDGNLERAREFVAVGEVEATGKRMDHYKSDPGFRQRHHHAESGEQRWCVCVRGSGERPGAQARV